MKTIGSTDNQIYKKIAQLGMKKFRDKLGSYVIEGPNLIGEAIDHGGTLDLVVFKKSFLLEGCKTEIDLLRCQLEEKQIQVFQMEDKIFDLLSNTQTPQGVLAIVKKSDYQEERFFSSRDNSNGNIIVLDRLQDPGNIGTILRTADGAGYQGALIIKGTADVFSPKIVRAATGSLFRLPILMVNSAEEALTLLKKNKKTVICTALLDAKNYYDCPMSKDVAVIIGNEGNGVCDEFINKSDVRVTIPMSGSTESLNAAVAAGILIYESVRK